ncbi:protein phosphatase 1 regulatory subunit 1A isoform X1 [Hippocampus comes]|uniref:protein phosphatase 1 regulatory subunit 1A isoform X1 n=1 Tax=Hippocampus comes TaxID=109280 RepID=UPI00094E5226|nr:PREDICTED: protein phosphatase 1 regulatory subunit 1A isoform X1 [Hippocampus comes]XP_019716682.1 PREDICTED: protein phosphatase 1 regulatory subunit 1A isoform X1 [Hippocampus comes]
METGSPRKIQFTVPLLDTHLDPEAAEQIRRRRPTPATLVASSDQSSPEIDEDRLPNQLYKAALLNSPRQRRKGQKGTPTMKVPFFPTVLSLILILCLVPELQFLVEHHLYRQQQGGADECSSESCLSDRPSPDSVAPGEELPRDDEATAEAFEKLRCQMEAEFSRESLSEAAVDGSECPFSKEEDDDCSRVASSDPSSQLNEAQADTKAATCGGTGQLADEKTKKLIPGTEK